MAVDWRLGGGGFDASEVLQSFGNAQATQLARQRQEMALAQQQRQQAARAQGAEQVRTGDYAGATATAFSAGDYDFAKAIGGLQDDKRKELERHAEVIGRVAFGLRGVPADQRRQQLQALAPQLSAYGIDAGELDNADLSDEGLNGYVAISQSVKDALAGQLVETRIADVGTDNTRADTLARNTINSTQTRLGFAANADRRGAAANARAAEARGEGRVRFRERDKDRAAVAAGGRGVRTDLSDLDY